MVISKDLPFLPQWPGDFAVSNILENRDDILAAKYRFDAASLDLQRAKRRNYPALKITSSLIKSSPELNTLAKDKKAFSASGLAMEAPLIDGGKAEADTSILSAEKEEAALIYQQKNKAALSEIETVWMNEEILKKRKECLEVVLKENIKALELAKRQYESGTIDSLIVLYHMIETDETKVSLLHLKTAQLIQRADLYYSLGQQK
jgi:multidrug efflux system outer membrane protein